MDRTATFDKGEFNTFELCQLLEESKSGCIELMKVIALDALHNSLVNGSFPFLLPSEDTGIQKQVPIHVL